MRSFTMSMLISNEAGHEVVRRTGPHTGPEITFILNDWLKKYSAKRKVIPYEVAEVEKEEFTVIPLGPMQFIFITKND